MSQNVEKLEDAIGFLLWNATRAMTRMSNEFLMVHGISTSVFPFLRTLWEKDGVTQRHIAKRIGVSGATTVVALRQLEQAGYVKRTVDKTDARKILVSLTKEGRKLYGLVIPDIDTVMNACLIDFSEQEKLQLRQLLHRFRSNIADNEDGALRKKTAKRARKVKPKDR